MQQDGGFKLQLVPEARALALSAVVQGTDGALWLLDTNGPVGIYRFDPSTMPK